MLSKFVAVLLLSVAVPPSVLACPASPPEPERSAVWFDLPRPDQIRPGEIAVEIAQADNSDLGIIVDGELVIGNMGDCVQRDALARIAKVLIGDAGNTDLVVLPKGYSYVPAYALASPAERQEYGVEDENFYVPGPLYVVGRLVPSDYRLFSDPNRMIMMILPRQGPG